MRTTHLPEITAALRAATTDPHRLLSVLAQEGRPALFDALLSSTTLKPTSRLNTQVPVSGRFRGARSTLLLRGLIALAPPGSAVAERLRRQWTGVVLSGDSDRPGPVSARYLGRISGLKQVHIEQATGVGYLSDLAALPRLELLSFVRCSLLNTDLSGLCGARIDALHWSGQSLSVQEDFPLVGLSGVRVGHLKLSDVWKISRVDGWPDGLTTLTIQNAPTLLLPALPPTLTTLHVAAARALSFDVLPASLESLTLIGVALPELASLPPLPHLHTLQITRGSAADLRWLPAGLTTLTLANQIRLQSLAGIEGVSGLVHLDLTRCTELSDLTPLAALGALESVNLRGCTGVTDLSPLRSLPTLRRILSDNPAFSMDAQRSGVTPASSRKPSKRQSIPAAYTRATQTIRELLRSNDPDATEQAIELVRSLCSPQLVDILLDGVVVKEESGWQEVVAGRRFSSHRQPAALSFIAQAGVGESLTVRTALHALRVSIPMVDVADLSALPALKKLSLVGVKAMKNPGQLGEMERLSTLLLQRCVLPEGTKIPVGVRHFEADRLQHWVDLTPLSDCGRLESVIISDAPSLVSVRGLASPVLAGLSLGRAESLESVRALADNPALERLHITGAMKLARVTALADHPALSSLQIHHAVRLQSIPALPMLTALTLDGAPISTLPALPALSLLSLQRCAALQILGPLGTHLTSVRLMHCDQLTTIAPLASSRSLLGLHLIGCPLIGDLSPLAGMTRLTRLTVRDRPLPLDLTPLAGCRALTELDLRGCTNLTGLPVLSTLPALAILRLGRTGLTHTDLPPALRRRARWGR